MKYFLRLLVFSFSLFPLAAQSLQHVENLKQNDPVYQQLMQDIMENYKRLAVGKNPLPLNLFTYRTKKHDTLYSVAARLNLPYDTIATLNSIASPSLFPRGDLIYLPNMSGIATRSDENDPFLSSLEDRLKQENSFGLEIPGPTGKRIAANFYPGHKFTSSERTTFLSSFLLPPLRGMKHVITSPFGRRGNPFKSGHWEIHTGIDYRAPMRSAVYAARFGRVVRVGNHPILGTHIVIRHEKRYETVYGHLSRALVQQGDRISSGQVIAESGNTGRSTGPHLHFEVRKDGMPINPLPFLRRKN